MTKAFDGLLEKLNRGTITQKAVHQLLVGMQTEGAHHKQWYMDQALRILAGGTYGDIVRLYEEPQPGETVPYDTFYQWDKGIAP